MSELRKANTDYPYFITLTIVDWLDIFTRYNYCDILVESLKYCVKNKGLEIYAYVIMPSHIHLIVRNENSILASIIRDFKSFTAKQIIYQIKNSGSESRTDWIIYHLHRNRLFTSQNTNYCFWQKTNYAIELSTPNLIDQKTEYIHNNPVEAGYVLEPESWYYSSACVMSPIEVLRA